MATESKDKTVAIFVDLAACAFCWLPSWWASARQWISELVETDSEISELDMLISG